MLLTTLPKRVDMEYFTDSIECLSNGAPHAKEAGLFCECFQNLEPDLRHSFVRCFITADFFQKVERLRGNVDFTIADYKNLLKEETELAQRLIQGIDRYKEKLEDPEKRENLDDRSFTQEHYGNLFKNFSEHHYFEEPYELLSTRLKRNDIHLDTVADKTALDCGCGSGRYTIALKKLGFGKVVGIDFSETGIKTARERATAKNIRGIEYKVGDVLSLPFADESFDFVFCNGVLHHSRSIAQGIDEMVRVMKSKGKAWLYLISKPGGIHWDTVELLRQIMRPVSQEYARRAFRMQGIPENRVFYILDHIMVPINTLSSTEEIEEMLRSNTISDFKRLERGTDFDLSEKLWQLKQKNPDDPELVWKFGVGEHRYVFSKP